MRKSFRLMAFMLSILAGLMLTSQASAVGFKYITEHGMKIGVWYPSPAPEEVAKLGPFDVTMAMDAEPEAQGRFQVVFISHGNGGYLRNHHLTGKALAEAGFIAIAPTHTVDHLMAGDDDDIAKALEWRVSELRYALEEVLRDEKFRRIIDLSRIHAIGYSLGSLTVLYAAGANIDIDAALEHCDREDDPTFCEVPDIPRKWTKKRLKGLRVPDLERDVPRLYFPLGFVNGGVAAVAPLGQGVDIDPNTFTASGLMVVGLEKDEINLPRFHADNLNALFSDHVNTEYHMYKGNHFAFIARFAERVPDIEHIPIMQDPEGFDRSAFLEDVNGRLVTFFNKNKS